MRLMTAAAMAAVLTLSGHADAAELKVLAGGAMTASLKDLGPKFEAATGHRLTIQFAGTPELIKLSTSQAFDLGVVPVEVMKNDAARAKFAPGVDIARVGYGVAVRAGAPKPDVSNADALKAALLKAQSVALFPESAAGAYVLKTFERLGIADAMKPKIKAVANTTQIPEAVAKGDAELGVFLTNVMAAPGVELAGPFPGDLQSELVFTGALAADTKEADAAKAFIAYLKTPEAAAVIKQKGMTPG